MKKLQSVSEQDKIEAMRQIIAQASRGGESYMSIHRITKEVVTVKNNELKRLFYYYLELIPKSRESESFEEILLLLNQIRKDLEHPNEYVRGLSMKFVSTLEDSELLGNFYKPIRDNLSHPNAYVRRSAYFCLGTIYSKVNAYKEIPDLLHRALLRDLDSTCLRQAFSSLWITNQELALAYVNDVSTSIPSDLSIIIIEKIQDKALLSKFLLSDDPLTAFEAAIKMHGVTKDEEVLHKCTDIIFKHLDDLQNCREYVIDELSRSKFSFSGYAYRFLDLIDPYDICFCEKCLDFVFNIAETHDLIQVSDFLYRRFVETCSVSEQNQSFKTLLLEKAAHLADIYSMYNDDMMSEAFKCIDSENPAIAYASLQFISSCLDVTNRWLINRKIEQNNEEHNVDLDSCNSQVSKYYTHLSLLAEKINDIRYGKVLRRCLAILKRNVDKQILEKVIGVFDSSFESTEKPLYLQDAQAFLPSFICIELSEMCLSVDEDHFKERAIAMMLKFISHGEQNPRIDLSSRSTIVLCIRSLLHAGKLDVTSFNGYKKHSIDVLSQIIWPGVERVDGSVAERLHEFLSEKRPAIAEMESVVQLTGLSDPIYVEATVCYTKFEILLDLLFVNQTCSYLQDILLDITTSPNMKPTLTSQAFSMQERSACTRKHSFRVIDGSNGFIGGWMTFRYPSESGEYANTVYTINLSEIRTSISEFLEPCQIHPDEFRETWKELEWENAYTLRFQTNFGIQDIFDGVARDLHGKVVNLECGENYIVGNVACYTLQNTHVLINVCLQKGETVYFESRIRSKKEHIVKSVSAVICDILKSFRNK